MRVHVLLKRHKCVSQCYLHFYYFILHSVTTKLDRNPQKYRDFAGDPGLNMQYTRVRDQHTENVAN